MPFANALGPVFLLILLGVALRRIDFPGAVYWPGIERLTYYIAFPALLVHRLAQADFSQTDILPMGGVIIGALGVTVLSMWLARPLLGRNGADFSSVFQGGIRFNTYIGLAVTSALLGDAGLVLAAIALALMIPLVNVFCVLTLVLVSTEQRTTPGTLIAGVLRNPLILACLLGVLLNLSGIGLPGWSAEVLARLGGAALPLGLLAVGVALHPGTVRRDWLSILASSTVKFGLFPGLMLAVGTWMGLDTLALQILVLLACLPTATAAYILARELGGNAPMMANIISVQTLLAFLAMPLWLAAIAG